MVAWPKGGIDVPDWVALKERYVKGGMSYRSLAGESGVPYGQLSKRGAQDGWSKARKAREQCDKLELLKQSADLAQARIGAILSDDQQFHRHLVRYGRDGESGVEELIFDKVDTKALRDVVGAIRDMAGIVRDLHGLMSDKDKARLGLAAHAAQEAGVIQLPLREDAP